VAANFSASDLRALNKNSFRDFGRSVLVFLTKSGQGVTPVVSVSENSTLEEAMTRMASEHLHRVYITSAQTGSIRGLVSNADVIKLVHKHTHHHHHHSHHHHSHHHDKKSKK
jgi:CBS domain-containing protein